MKTATKALLAAAVVVLAPAFGSYPAQAEELLAQMQGTWRGSGWGRPEAGAPKETVRCRVKGDYAPGSQRITLTGNCASPGNKFQVNGYVQKSPQTGKITGRWSNPTGPGSAYMTGQIQGGDLVLSYDARDDETGRRVDGQMTWSIGAKGFSITSSARDAKTGSRWQAGSLRFQ